MEAFLKHGEWGGPYRKERVAVRTTEAPRNYSRTGYGRHLPTQYMVQVEGRWRRVYCVCISNVGTLYVGKSPATGTVVDLYD